MLVYEAKVQERIGICMQWCEEENCLAIKPPEAKGSYTGWSKRFGNTNSMKSRDESPSVDVCALRNIIAQFLSIVSMVHREQMCCISNFQILE